MVCRLGQLSILIDEKPYNVTVYKSLSLDIETLEYYPDSDFSILDNNKFFIAVPFIYKPPLSKE